MRAVLSFKIQPQAKERPRFTKVGHAYKASRTREFEDYIKLLAKAQFLSDPLDGPLSINIQFNIKKPKSVKREFPCVRPDIDNYAKAVLDALNGVVFKDDGQIVDLNLSKRYGDAGIIVEVEEL